jgi:hypothetical protein
VGPRTVLAGCEKSRPHLDSIPGPSSPWRVAIPKMLLRPTEKYSARYFAELCEVQRITVPKVFPNLSDVMIAGIIVTLLDH